MIARHRIVFLSFLLFACQDPVPNDRAANAPDRRAEQRPDQLWTICQDPNRGLAAADACAALIQSGQVTGQRLAYVHYNRGLALSRRGRTQAAIADFDTVLGMDPLFALAFHQRGLAYRQLGQSLRAEQDLQRARQLDARLQ